MDIVILALRLIHVFSGVFWVGAALAMTFFITPTVGATAEAGQKFMSHLMSQTRFSNTMMIVGVSTVLAGAAMYWIDSNGFTSDWMMAGPGIGFGLGAVLAVVGLGAGMMIPRAAASMGKLAAQFKGAPTPDQQSQMAALRKRMALVSTVNAYCLIIATVLMATARYWRF
jgi:uncharacterized membrane protein